MANTETWRDRLACAVEDSKKSKRALSIAIGRGGSYLHEILSSGKAPTIDNFIAIADALGVSATWLIFGIEMDGDSEKLLRIYSSLDPDQKKHFLSLADSLSSLSKNGA